MLTELSKQVSRLFSSKNNGGKQVPKLTEKLHISKQVLIALSLALLVGYSGTRELFTCQHDGIDKVTLKNFCLTNGTSTVVSDNPDQEPSHVGLSVVTNERDYPVISHNYIRSLWVLLILLAICSYFPQRRWASIFQNETLQALLMLPGHKDSKLVQAAEQARPYELLSRVTRQLNLDQTHISGKQTKLSNNELLMHRIEMIESYNNVYDHKLDYYPNQLIYLLLTSNTAAYKSSFLKLRSELIYYSLWSTTFTMMQFVLPITFIGLEYKTYGWKYACLLKDYLISLAKSQQPISYVNSIDYNLSMRIFPTSTACDFRQQGLTGEIERVIVQCTVAMNEICGKLFVAIWWIVVVNIAIEFWSLCMLIMGSFNCKLTSLIYGLRYWPAMREQADKIASFRHRRATLINRCKQIRELRQQLKIEKRKNNNKEKAIGSDQPNGAISERERKRLEAEGRRRYSDDSDSYRRESWLIACTSGLLVATFEWAKRTVCCLTSRRRNNHENEPKRDINIYYLFYLVYLRLGNSRSKTEDVIRMTSVALDNHLRDLETQCAAEELNSNCSPDNNGTTKVAGKLEGEIIEEQAKKINNELLDKETICGRCDDVDCGV